MAYIYETTAILVMSLWDVISVNSHLLWMAKLAFIHLNIPKKKYMTLLRYRIRERLVQ